MSKTKTRKAKHAATFAEELERLDRQVRVVLRMCGYEETEKATPIEAWRQLTTVIECTVSGERVE